MNKKISDERDASERQKAAQKAAKEQEKWLREETLRKLRRLRDNLATIERTQKNSRNELRE